MKKVISVIAIMLVVSVSAFAIYTTGFGVKGTATTTSQRFKGFTAATVSIINNSATDDLFAAVDCTTNTFDALVLATNAVCIPATMAYTFNAQDQDSISSFCVATTNGTADFVVATY